MTRILVHPVHSFFGPDHPRRMEGAVSDGDELALEDLVQHLSWTSLSGWSSPCLVELALQLTRAPSAGSALVNCSFNDGQRLTQSGRNSATHCS